MDEKVVNAFVRSALEVLGTELGGPVSMGRPSVQGVNYVTQGVATLVGVTGGLRGMVIFGLSEATALGMVSRMMGQEFRQLDEVALSGIAELGNVVVGASVTSLAMEGCRCGLTPPAVVVGRDTVVSMPSIKRLVLPLITPMGELEMQLALKGNGVR